MSAEDFKYSPRYLGKKDTTKLKSNWDNDLIMHWIETQPNPLLAPEFYEPMAEHDSPQIALSRDIREHLGEFWSPGEDFIHPLAVEFLEHEEVSSNLIWTVRETMLMECSGESCCRGCCGGLGGC